MEKNNCYVRLDPIFRSLIGAGKILVQNSNVEGYLKGKSAITIVRKFGGRKRNFTGEAFWARGYFVSTVGLDEEMVRAYIRNQEQEEERYDQMKLEL